MPLAKWVVFKAAASIMRYCQDFAVLQNENGRRATKIATVHFGRDSKNCCVASQIGIVNSGISRILKPKFKAHFECLALVKHL